MEAPRFHTAWTQGRHAYESLTGNLGMAVWRKHPFFVGQIYVAAESFIGFWRDSPEATMSFA